MRQDICDVLVEALYWRIAYDDSNPDVGMGPSKQSLLDRILIRSGVSITRRELDYILNHLLIKGR